MIRRIPLSLLVANALCLLLPLAALGQGREVPDYESEIQPIFNKHCVGCHNPDEREGGLNLESFQGLSEGGDSGPAVSPADLDGSRMWRLVALGMEPKMPPDDLASPSAEELDAIKRWIVAGAPGPDGDEPRPRRLIVPQIAPMPDARSAITAVAYSPDGSTIALARYGKVELLDPTTSELKASINDLPGKVNSIAFSSNSQLLLTASGVTGLEGQANLWKVSDGSHVQTFRGHRDEFLAAAIAPSGSLVATAGYDRVISIWNAESGSVDRTLEGHNGAIYSLQFDPTSTLLLSASADQTLKVWSVASGERFDTLGQPLKEQFCCLFSPTGDWMLGAGADNRIRRWSLVSKASAQINPLELAQFAHEGAIVALAISSDSRYVASAAEDRTLKFWQASDLTELVFLPDQSDIVAAIAFAPDGQTAVVGRLDGSWEIVDFPKNSSSDAGEANIATLAPMPSDVAPQAQTETEPNDDPAQATAIALPAQVTGVIGAANDADLFRFEAKTGQPWMIEVDASRSGSPLDSYLEIVDANGERVPRVLLQAIRDSYFTFRGKDSATSDDFRVHNWEEMELNELLYADGEVVRLWLYPRGPDSGFKVYPGVGNRYTYFDTTAVSHALGAPCYVVKPHPVGTRLIPNGLPVFELPFENDDDSRRRWGSDSRLLFQAPADGEYFVRLRDVRGFGGEPFRYTLTVRPQQPDFQASIGGRDPQVAPGCGREFSINVVRLDDFEGPIEVQIEGLPPGFHATTPIIVEPGQDSAVGVIWADLDAVAPTAEQSAQVKIVARAEAMGKTIEHPLSDLGNIQLAAPSQVRVRIAPASGELSSVDATLSSAGATATPWPGEAPVELTIHPGETIVATVLIERNEFAGGVPLGNDDSGRNLPHGVYIDNIGLNGLLVIENQNERVFFITAAPMATPQDRWFHLKARIGGEPCSLPVLLHVVPKP